MDRYAEICCQAPIFAETGKTAAAGPLRRGGRLSRPQSTVSG
jgi:hypothetical protein